MDDRFVALNPIPQSKPFPAPSEARAWSSEDTRRHGCKVNLPVGKPYQWLRGSLAGQRCRLATQGHRPLSSLRKDCASLTAEIPTAASWLAPNLVAVFTNRRRQSALRRDILDSAVV